MRFLGIILFISTMVWTWNWVRQANSKEKTTHVQIQIEMEELIQSTIKTHRPQATDLRVHQVWTESLRDGKIKAYFNYTFKEPAEEDQTSQTIRGYAILTPSPSEQPNDSSWTVTEVKAENAELIFENGLLITPGSSVSQ